MEYIESTQTDIVDRNSLIKHKAYMERKLYRQNAMKPPLILRRRGGRWVGIRSTISLNDSHSRRRNLVVLACGERRKTKRMEKEPKNDFTISVGIAINVGMKNLSEKFVAVRNPGLR